MNIRPVFLVVNRLSYRYIDSVAEYILQTLKHITGSEVSFELADNVEEIKLPYRSIVFIIGDPFPRFVKDEGCFYIFINFSLLYNVNRNRKLNWRASRWISQKHKAFMKKVKSFDLIVDFYHPQTLLLKQELEDVSIEVMPFLTNVTQKPRIVPSLKERKWDICVVGTLSSRRIKVYKRLRKLGYQLSPFESSDIQSVIADSKLTLNIHVQDCDTLEAPRVIQTLSLGGCLVTEHCYGLEKIVPNDCYCCVQYSNLVSEIDKLLENIGRIQDMGVKAKRYMQEHYEGNCLRCWESIVEAIPC